MSPVCPFQGNEALPLHGLRINRSPSKTPPDLMVIFLDRKMIWARGRQRHDRNSLDR